MDAKRKTWLPHNRSELAAFTVAAALLGVGAYSQVEAGGALAVNAAIPGETAPAVSPVATDWVARIVLGREGGRPVVAARSAATLDAGVLVLPPMTAPGASTPFVPTADSFVTPAAGTPTTVLVGAPTSPAAGSGPSAPGTTVPGTTGAASPTPSAGPTAPGAGATAPAAPTDPPTDTGPVEAAPPETPTPDASAEQPPRADEPPAADEPGASGERAGDRPEPSTQAEQPRQQPSGDEPVGGRAGGQQPEGLSSQG